MHGAVHFAVKKKLGSGLHRLLGRTPTGTWFYAVVYSLAAPQRPMIDLSWPDRLQLLRLGYLPVSSVLYGSVGDDLAGYLSDRQREKTQTVNGRAARLLGDKIAFYFMLAHVGAPTPAVEAVVMRGRLHAVDAEGEGVAWLRQRLSEGGRVVLKPAGGGAGAGVFVLSEGQEGLTVNDEPVTWADAERRLSVLDDYIVTPYVEQAEYSAKIHARTTNTVRVLTMIDSDGQPFIAAAVHRFGTTKSYPVDNWSQGGLSASVDLETGRLGAAAVFPRSGSLRWETHHPDTGARIEGKSVPHWTVMCDGIRELAARLRFIPYVGWDVIVTENGYVVLEGNQYSDVNLLQVHRPLLQDPRVRDFYKRHGIAKRAQLETESP